MIWGRRKEEKKFGSLGWCEGAGRAGLHMVTVEDSARGLARGRRTGTEPASRRLRLQDGMTTEMGCSLCARVGTKRLCVIAEKDG